MDKKLKRLAIRARSQYPFVTMFSTEKPPCANLAQGRMAAKSPTAERTYPPQNQR
jgi:hypothetical protein